MNDAYWLCAGLSHGQAYLYVTYSRLPVTWFKSLQPIAEFDSRVEALAFADELMQILPGLTWRLE